MGKFIKCQATHWDKDVKTSARFNTFNGKRLDCEAQFQFWRDLIIKDVQHLGRIIIDTEEVNCPFFTSLLV